MMTLERWIAVIFLMLCVLYGYQAYVVMDAGLPPFMHRNPVWPSTFPKILCVIGALAALAVILFAPKDGTTEEREIDHRRLLTDYNWGQALALIGLLIAFSLAMRPLGFLFTTFAFLVAGGWILGERTLWRLCLVGAATSLGIWYLVQQVLGIFLSPFPLFLA
ncbi:MAG: tripartite tricarboxylate transporter TctB family protein [Rhodospirillum sp.]|nr:tripartite tricarboxylate transporter TctB family protein [Rhodospirillum sp.]MCF8491076.1 tripartite tricarboxylate transporter TctB family protein [Rhodospirillum sp.]MCF8500220.1 tripartite tricarboxylate transporter TctB family protein [Rhodospirillum sp.]